MPTAPRSSGPCWPQWLKVMARNLEAAYPGARKLLLPIPGIDDRLIVKVDRDRPGGGVTLEAGLWWLRARP